MILVVGILEAYIQGLWINSQALSFVIVWIQMSMIIVIIILHEAWINWKACESGFPDCFLTGFTKFFFFWESTSLNFGFLTRKFS